jgi:hypothetical protein
LHRRALHANRSPHQRRRHAATCWRSPTPRALATQATCLASSVTESERRLEREGCSDYWGYDYRVRPQRRCGHPGLATVKARS